MTTNETVNHPSHYTSHKSGVECVEIAERYGFLLGNTWKYLWRANEKHESPLEDLEKAEWYLERYINNGRENFDEPPFDVFSDEDALLIQSISQEYSYNVGTVMHTLFFYPDTIGAVGTALELVQEEIKRLTPKTTTHDVGINPSYKSGVSVRITDPNVINMIHDDKIKVSEVAK